MNNEVLTVTVKGVGDFSDVVSNVGSVQKALTKLKLPDKLGDSLNKNISNFMKEYDKYQKKVAEGIHTQGDQNAVNKSLNSMLDSYEKIIKDLGKISTKDFKDIFNLDEGQFASVQKRIKDIEANMKKIKLDPKQLTEPLKIFQDATKAKSLFGNGKGFDRLGEAFQNNNLEEAKVAIQEIDNYLTRFGSRMDTTKLERLKTAFEPLKQHVLNTDKATEGFTQDINKLNQVISEIGERGVGEFNQFRTGLEGTESAAKSVVAELKQLHANEFDFNRQAADIDRQIQSYFGLSQMIRKVGDIARDAFATVKDLDKAMTETAVVTNFSVGDMWDMLPTYTAQANQLGSTIKDVYEAATLYYQQGLNTNQAMGLANETLKMARIAGLDATEATNMMTAALRGFNMEVNQTSAQKINDIYSELAAITASDTKEIGSAMERTASIANAANMDFATTSAFLAQMIETTREAPENLGTAMKTIVARFQEMKQDPTKLVDSEGVAMDVNKVDKALKTIGVSLTNTKGEFRDLDDVFLDISAKWDSLSQGQQRYIATIAAGSRQQSRFIAMMSNYERTMELVDAANNSAGASQRQFEKTLDSMAAKLNMLKNAWDQFTMGLMNNQILKFGVDRLTDAFTIVNKFIDVLGSLPPKPFEGITKSVLTLVTTLGMLNFGKKASRGLVMGGAAWWKGEEGGFGKNFMSGFSGQAAKAGTADGQVYAQNFNNALKKGQLKEAFQMTKKRAAEIQNPTQYANTAGAAFAPFSAEQITRAIRAQGSESQIANEIRDLFTRACAMVDSKAIGREEAQELANGLAEDVISGKTSFADAAGTFQLATDIDINEMGVNALPTKEVDKLGNSLTKAGSSLQTFGMALQDTPLAPFGALLSKIGMLTNGFGEAVGKAFTIFKEGMAGTAVAEAEVGAGATAMAAGEATATAATGGLIGGIQALWGALLESPLFPIVAAILALIGVYKLLDAAIETNKEKLESASDAAAAASEAYDSAKQETSELADSIAQIEETDAAFDNLVAGTAEFNEQLVTANEQILALIDKYPMLMEGGYVSTDKNGLMHISDEGFKAVKEYQKQIQANASAMNLIQTADLNAEENRQKADKLRAQRGALTLDEIKKNERNADLLEQRAKAEVDLARSNAIRTALSGKELRDTEALTAVYTSLYDEKRKAAETEVNGLDAHDIRQRYADYHGYTYDKSTKKIKDVEGNEINYDDKAIKDEVIEQTVLLDFEANASSLEGVLDKLDKAFSGTLEGSFDNSSHFISDILSSNIETNTDLLENVLESPKELQGVVDSLSAKEVEAILGLSAGTVSDVNFDQYKNDVVDLLLDRASNIMDAQAESYSQLASMLAQSKGWTTSEATNIIGNKETIQSMLRDLTAQQANTLSTIGQTLNDSVGSGAMATFIRDASNIYLRESQDVIDKFDGIIDGINWESAASRLEGYHNAINSTDKSIQQWGQDMRNSADEANILGQAFLEFGNDWEELADKADEFKNAAGEIDGAGILKAAESSKALNSLLESGEVSATGVAMALQGIEEGKYSISAVDTTVLQLLSSLNRLADAAYEAHNIIENFDPGIDTGEGEDFVIDNAKKAQEYYDNGEVGNQQLQNYIKLAAGTERWNKALKDNHGDIGAATDDLMKYVNTFSGGFEKAWDQMAAGKGINGKTLSKNIAQAVDDKAISSELAQKFEKVKTSWEDGFLDVNFGELTTSELETYFEKAYGVSQEYAKLLVQDLANYDATVSSMLAKNDLKETVQSEAFQRDHMVNGQMILSDAQIQAFEAAGGSMEELARAAGTTATALEKNQFKVLDDSGNRIDNSNDPALLQSYIKTFEKAEKGSIQSLFETGVKELFTNNKLDLNKLVADTQLKGMDQTQAMQAAWQAYQRGEQLGKRTTAGETELKQGIKNYEEFVNEMNSSLETDKWVHIGEAIAQGAMNFFNKQEAKENEGKPETPSKESQTPQKPAGMPESNWRRQQGDQTAERQPLQKLWDLFVKGPQTEYQARQEQSATGKTAEQLQSDNKAFWSSLIGNSDRAAAARDQKLTAGLQQVQKNNDTSATDSSNAATDTSNAAADTTTAATNLTSAATALNAAATALNGAATKIASQNTQPGITPPTQPVQQQQSVAPTIDAGGTIVQKVVTEAVGTEEVQAQINDIKSKADAGASMKVKGVIDSSINTLKDTTSSVAKVANKTTVVKAKATGMPNINKLKTGIEGVQNKEVSVTASTSGLPDVKSLKRAISALKSKTIDIVTNKITKNSTSGGGAVGINNSIPVRSIPQAGSLARGKKGRNGPRNKGGLTLTGELGYEVAWLPSESRSVILGAEGPQMVQLPADAVVYNHEQSKDILKKKQTIEAGSLANTRRRKGGGGGSSSKKGKGSKGKKGNSKKNKDKDKNASNDARIVNNFSIEEVVRFDIDRNLEALTSNINKLTKDIDKNLGRIGTKATDISAKIKEQVANLQAVKKNNEDLAASYQRDLNTLDTGGYETKISYDAIKTKTEKKKKKTKTTKEVASKDEYINLSDYIYKDDNGNYQIDKNKIAQAGSKERQEAIFKAAESALNPLVSGLQKAKDAAEDAKDKIDDLANKVSETFYQWENEITEVYDLTQRLNKETSLRGRFASQVSLELAKLNSGFGSAASSISIMQKSLERDNKTLVEQLKNQQLMISARERELQAALSEKDEIEQLVRLRDKTTYNSDAEKKATVQWATDQYNATALGRKYLNNVRQSGDGSLQYEINWQQFESDRQANPYNKQTYDAIKKFLDELDSAAVEFNNAIKDQTDLIKETYEALKEYQDFIGDFEDTLIKGLEQEIESNIDSAKQLSDSITDALKDLLDEVKRKLDERRQEEENRKTEQDISQKQQRLAALRANTAGGNQVEIARLEQEIADAQQSYERTLEDQLLERLQAQADEAQRQRDQIIRLMEQQNTIATSNNRELVNMWLKDPVKYKEEIRNAWLEAQEYDEKGAVQQALLRQEFESGFTNLKTAIEQTGFEGYFANSLTNMSTLVGVANSINSNLGGLKAQSNTTAKNTNTSASTTQASLKTAAPPAPPKAAVSTSTKATTPAKTAAQIAAENAAKAKQTNLKAYQTAMSEVKNKKAKNVTAADVNMLFTKGAAAGFGKASVLSHLVGNYGGKDPFSWESLMKGTIIEANGIDRYNLVKTWPNDVWLEKGLKKLSSNPKTLAAIKANKKYKSATALKFASGGLADYTGPAWLDGTRSKPELVLNAADTKNFIALKDVLAHAMNSAGHIENSYGGDATYEININVDHLNNDYDVDKVVERVKKKIIQDSGYRNVTQVRKLR